MEEMDWICNALSLSTAAFTSLSPSNTFKVSFLLLLGQVYLGFHGILWCFLLCSFTSDQDPWTSYEEFPGLIDASFHLFSLLFSVPLLLESMRWFMQLALAMLQGNYDIKYHEIYASWCEFWYLLYHFSSTLSYLTWLILSLAPPAQQMLL